MLPNQKATFQVINVNPFFNDQSSEILLLVRTSDSVFEYSLQFPKAQRVRAVIATPDFPARMFPYHHQLALLLSSFGPAKGIYVLPLPLKSGGTLSLISVDDPRFDTIAGELNNAAKDGTVRDQFCESRRYDFITFYEKYAGYCEEQGNSRGTAVTKTFDQFWKKN